MVAREREGFISFLNSSIVRCGNLKLNNGQHVPFDQASYLWQPAQRELLGVHTELMLLTAVMSLEMWHEQNKEWERDMFLKSPSMTHLSSSPSCFPADPGRISQHAAHKAICLTSCTPSPAGQWTAGTVGYGVGSLQQQDDKCSPQVTNTNPLWLTHMICLPTYYRKLGILGLFMSYDFCGTAIKLSYKIRTNLTLFKLLDSVTKDYL